MVLVGYLSGIGYGLLCLALSFILYKLGMPKRYTRKVVHILVGFEWVFLYNFMGAGVHFLAVCVAFLALLMLAYFLKLMPMISSDADNAPGTVYYAVAMTGVAIVGCFVPEVMLPFGVGIFATSIGDGLAGFIGQALTHHNPKIYGKKTLFGALACFLFTLASATIMSVIFEMGLSWWQLVAIGFLAMLLELITGYGFDNITITWCVTALTYAFMYFPSITNYLAPILLTPIIIAFARAKRALSGWGIVMAVLLDAMISVSLGNIGFLLLLLFFIGSIGVDKLKKHIKSHKHEDEGLKGDCRDHMQVLANGLVPALCAVVFLVSKHPIFIVAFVASLAEAFADTAASGIGAFSSNTIDPFRMKRCQPGISGGMSLLGTLASAVFAFLLSLVALGFGIIDLKLALIATLSAFVGAIFDSFLGSLFQVKYKCVACGKITEKHIHCNEKTIHYRGLNLIDNDVVNLLSALFSAALAITVAMLL